MRIDKEWEAFEEWEGGGYEDPTHKEIARAAWFARAQYADGACAHDWDFVEETGDGHAEFRCDLCGKTELVLGEWSRRARAALDAQKAGPNDPLTDFEEGQWWIKELDALVATGNLTNDQVRAVAVVHNMLRAAKSIAPKGEPVAWTTMKMDMEPISDQVKRARPDIYAKNYTVPLYAAPVNEQDTKDALLKACRRALLALAAASQHDPSFRADYELLNEAIAQQGKRKGR